MKNVNKWTLEDVRAIVVEVAKREQEYEFLEKMEIAYNGRLSRTLARCLTEITRRNGVTVEARPFKLEFGKTILNVETKEALEQTVLHEVAHAIANKKYKDNCGHDERFKMVCEKIINSIQCDPRAQEFKFILSNCKAEEDYINFLTKIGHYLLTRVNKTISSEIILEAATNSFQILNNARDSKKYYDEIKNEYLEREIKAFPYEIPENEDLNLTSKKH